MGRQTADSKAITLNQPEGIAVSHKSLADLTPDARNANKGTERGSQMIENSLRQYGAGRSILLDKHGRIIAGNKTAENFGSIGLDDVIVARWEAATGQKAVLDGQTA